MQLLIIPAVLAIGAFLFNLATGQKATLEMVVRDVAIELTEYGIRVNVIAPGAKLSKYMKGKTAPTLLFLLNTRESPEMLLMQ